MKRKAGEMSASLENNIVIPNETPFRVVSEENLHRYQEQVNSLTFREACGKFERVTV